ncbi:MAG: hypothetical protein HDR17_00315, partial [Lachnospiraceae bacterium]|nr:hypothetical protein [Lachnospiraceae bacterium]
MAKKTALKKSKRRLKRTVRRSIAAVLMVTAIAVAAIPVPENLADESDEMTGGDAGIQYVEATVDEYVPNPGSNNTVNKYVDYSDDQLIAAVTGEYPDLEQTEIVVRDGQSLVLTWQFLYERIGTSQFGRLCKYNDYFPRDVVNLGLQPNKNYFVVKATEFSNYFGADPKSCGIDYMDNLSPSNQFYPTNALTYSYLDYDPRSGSVILDEKTVAFFQKYFERDFNTKTEEFKAYYAANDSSLNPPEEMVKTPANDLDSNQQIDFFCEHNNLLKGTKYRLTAATDQRLGHNSELVYVAYSTEKSEDLPYGYVDVDGYLVLLDVRYISIIADKAFYNVQNVGQIDFSDKVQNIGESAFENSGITS